MKKAIYKIENKINHKVYIGQSIDPEKRFLQHCQKKEYLSLISKAIQKYGKENFSLEILGWFEDYNEKEKYYISFYKSITPYGYNLVSGGEEPPYWHGENHPMAKLTQEIVEKIQKDLLDFSIPQRTIIKKYKLTNNEIRHIKDGTSWHNDSLNYPLRPSEKELNEIKVQKVIELLLTTELSQKAIGQLVGWNRSAITMINIGKNHRQPNLIYPLRENNKHYKTCNDYPQSEE